MSDATDASMIAETARMYYERAMKAEAVAASLREYLSRSEVWELEEENKALCKALRRIASPSVIATRNSLAEIARAELHRRDKEFKQE